MVDTKNQEKTPKNDIQLLEGSKELFENFTITKWIGKGLNMVFF